MTFEVQRFGIMPMIALWGIRPWIPVVLAAIAGFWFELVRKAVPAPYLDEVFHLRQAYNYVYGNWRVWDPKITTPPGLYIASYPIARLIQGFAPIGTTAFRFTNLLGGILLLGVATRVLSLLNLKLSVSVKRTQTELLHAGVNICLFPLLFFFYGLYYTDVLSALSVLVTYQLLLENASNASMIFVAILSLWFRQTNVLWVSVFLGGVALCRSVPKGCPGIDFPRSPTFFEIIRASWQYAAAYDPPISEASFEDYIKSGLSFAVASIANPLRALRALSPCLVVLAVFGVYVMWNGGIVLGDKENHIVSIHLAQMLYLWPCFAFFSLPLLYPYVLSTIFPPTLLPETLRFNSTHFNRPRPLVAILIMIGMTTIVYYNTLVHPFTLADNRHYTFYVFRLLLRHPAVKYLAVPIYFLCAWAAITALGGTQTAAASTSPTESRKGKSEVDIAQSPPQPIASGNCASFLLVWLLASTASLITTSLVEPRYFIVPWLMWRLHIAPLRKNSTTSTRGSDGLYEHRLWLETAWFLLINAVTGYIFLNWGFEWPQEPRKVQRFMW
ncbi:hypothetical protein N7G274_006908 [Stereocaulon virgatum]|uniref:Dol-P-Glc:Glc(2)Man(9)GlcNAc(2)-PP-Dol alpha-1,2-glucosyltransferase n=1 Tax=Stereocaulon virgatum TaxID=373712 RepID=A0ABR4A4V3_9LECA